MERKRLLRLLAVAIGACIAVGVSIGALLLHAVTGPTTGASGKVEAEIDVEPDIRGQVFAGPNPQSWWCELPYCTSDFDVGGQGPMATIEAELQAIHSVGALYARIGVPWPLIETSPGTYDWTRLDAIVAAASRAGVVLEPDLGSTPKWAGGGPQLANAPSSGSSWAAFVTSLTQRYGRRFPYIEIGNEPDSQSSCNASQCEQTYVSSLLNPAYAAIKAVDPSIRVVMAGSANDAGSCCTYLSRVLADGARFDVATFHNYAGTYASEAAQYRSMLDHNGHQSAQLWMTEFGVKSTIGDQSAALRQVYNGEMPIQLAGWYNLRDTDAWSCCPPTDLVQGHWGLLNADFTPKASYETLQSLLGGEGTPRHP